ncbi:MAG: hypothetical protein ACXAD7_21685, partial [Candidatus Kariarchaeaceae archaeon]
MTKLTDDRVVDILRLIQQSVQDDVFHTPAEIERAKALAAKLYISHTNREITLSDDAFQLIIDFLQ